MLVTKGFGENQLIVTKGMGRSIWKMVLKFVDVHVDFLTKILTFKVEI